jgi:hypothetical protein
MYHKRYHNKRGQIAGQVFIYVMAVIVIGVIALIGYNAIHTIITKSCNVERANFKLDIEKDIETYTSDGSVWVEKINVPCGYDTICFVDASKIGDSSFTCNNKIIQNSVQQGNPQNMFVMAGQNTVQLGYSDLISLGSPYTDAALPPSCLCIKQRNNKFYITFNGKGSSIEVSAS